MLHRVTFGAVWESPKESDSRAVGIRLQSGRSPPLVPVFDANLEADKTAPLKQGHTVKRIFERLRIEHGFAGGYTVVKDYARLARAGSREVFVPLAHPPGHAQVDFGECIGVIGDVRMKLSSVSTCRSRMLASSRPIRRRSRNPFWMGTSRHLRFLAQVAGLNEDQVVVVEGARRAPKLPAQQSGLVLLTATEIERLNLEEVNDRLGATPAFRRGLECLRDTPTSLNGWCESIGVAEKSTGVDLLKTMPS